MSRKKKTKSRSQPSSAAAPPVQFRPSPELGDALKQFASSWATSRNEAARRLCCLAAFGFSQRHHDLVMAYSERRLGGGDFGRAAREMCIELQAWDTARCEEGKLPMTEDQREEVTVKIAESYVVYHRDPQEPEKEKQRVQVHVTR